MFRPDLSSLRTAAPGSAPTLTPAELALVHALLDRPRPAPVKAFVETLGATLYSWLSEGVRRGFSSMVKGATGAAMVRELDIAPGEELRAFASHFKGASYEGKNSVCLITHDVDYRACYDHVLWLAEIEQERGIRAAYYFLVDAGYKIESGLLRKLRAMGHEVGLHGHTYDLRMAYRSVKTIVRRLGGARAQLEDLLGEKIVGFRNHSLLLTHELLEAIETLEFHYDSGLYPSSSRDPFSMYFCWPFRYEGCRLMEVPVMWPSDTEVFRSMGQEESNVLAYFRRRLELVEQFRGVACINHHPSIVGGRETYYRALVAAVADSGMLNLTPGDLVARLYAQNAK